MRRSGILPIVFKFEIGRKFESSEKTFVMICRLLICVLYVRRWLAIYSVFD